MSVFDAVLYYAMPLVKYTNYSKMRHKWEGGEKWKGSIAYHTTALKLTNHSDQWIFFAQNLARMQNCTSIDIKLREF